jgi:prepilin-type N-terminal cleavage/methylation domain-containing protein
MTCRKIINQSGFTLIEIIATVVIVAIFSAMMLTMFPNAVYHSLIKSSDPLRRILKSSDLSKVMANINSDYIPYPRWKASTSYSASNPQNKILPTGMNGRFYICTTGGTSGTSEPLWRDNGETQDGNVTWKAGLWIKQTSYAVGDIVIPSNPNGHFYRCIIAGTSGTTEPSWLPTGSASVGDDSAQWKRLLGYLNLQIGTADSVKKDNGYGQYYVVENRFVKFVSNAIQPISTGEAENVLEVKIKNDEDEILTTLFTAKEN